MRRLAFAFVVSSVACGTVLGGDDDAPPLPARADAATDAAPAEPIDAAAIVSCERRLPCGGTMVVSRPGEPIALDRARFDVAAPARVCVESCLRLRYDPSGFGDTPADFVKLVDVEVRGGDAGADRAGGFNLGLARLPYVFVDGNGPFGLVQLAADRLPRDRWFHVRLDVRWATSPSVELFVDGELAGEGAIPPLFAPASALVVSVGTMPSGRHPDVDARYADVRLTVY